MWRPRRRAGVRGQQGMFQSVLNFSSVGGDSAGDLEILPMLKPLSEALGLAPGTRSAAVRQLLRRPIATLKDLRGVSLRRLGQQMARRNDLAFTVGLQQAESRGDISTTSADPRVPPTIEYHYLSTESDRVRMRQAVRTAVAVLQTKAFSSFFDELTELPKNRCGRRPGPGRLDAGSPGTAIHACGSCPMGPADDPDAVVDQYGRVHGVTGLRVADTSILPFAPSRGPAATAVMIGERIADFIRAEAAPQAEAQPETTWSRPPSLAE